MAVPPRGVAPDTTDEWQRPLHVEVALGSPSPHLFQLLTGLVVLQRAGALRMRLQVGRAGLQPHQARVDVTGGPVLVYDMADGAEIPRSDPMATRDADVYVKRSFTADLNDGLLGTRVVPYGLNYAAAVRSSQFWQVVRSVSSPTARLKASLQLAGGSGPFMSYTAFEPTTAAEERMLAAPLFLTRVWNPAGEPGESLDPATAEAQAHDRAELNAVRVGLVRSLRQRWKDDDHIGLAPTSYALDQHSDLVVRGGTARRSYLATLRRATVCVSTRGLFGSNPWKLGEYVAAGKAVVSERLAFEVPGLVSPTNLSLGDDVDELVDRVALLCSDTERRHDMTRANMAFYGSYLRPDVLVRRSLSAALTARSTP